MPHRMGKFDSITPMFLVPGTLEVLEFSTSVAKDNGKNIPEASKSSTSFYMDGYLDYVQKPRRNENKGGSVESS